MCCNNGTFNGGCQTSIANDGTMTTTSWVPVTVEYRVVSNNNNYDNGCSCTSSCGCNRCWRRSRSSCCGF